MSDSDLLTTEELEVVHGIIRTAIASEESTMFLYRSQARLVHLYKKQFRTPDPPNTFMGKDLTILDV